MGPTMDYMPADEELEQKLQDQFHGKVEVSEWYVR